MAAAWPRKADAAAAPTDGPLLKLQGLAELKKMIGGQLVQALDAQRLDKGAWQLAVFVAEELAQVSADGGAQVSLPVFLSPHDVRAAYDRYGVPPAALEKVKVMELRQLLAMMLEGTPDAVNPWRAVAFIASPDASKLAQELL